MKKLIALFSAAVMLVTFSACGQKAEQETTLPEETEVTKADVTVNGEENTTESATEVEVVTDASGEAVTDESGEAVTETVTVKPTEAPTKDTAKEDKTPKTKAEIIEYCNTALNRVKKEKPGYTKKAVMDPKSMPDWIASIIAKDEITKMAKGSNCNDDFPAAGFEWSSKLRPEDVTSAEIKVNGTTYDIMIKLGTEKNPAKGTKSSYGRVMSVIDAADAKEMISAVQSIDMLYHDGYVHVKVDSTTGKVTFAEFSATADLSAKLGITLNVDDVISTETFTNFVW